MNDVRIDMGKRMKAQRKTLHMTQEQIAEKLGITVKHYGGVERGTAGLSLDNLIELSNILDVNLDYLIKGIDNSTEIIPNRIKEIYTCSSPEKRQYIIELLEIIDKF